MKYIIIHHEKPIIYFDISLEVTLKNLLALIKQAIGSESPVDKVNEEDNKPPKNNKNLFIFIIVILTLLLFYSIGKNDLDNQASQLETNLSTTPSNQANSVARDDIYHYYLKQGEFVVKEFCIKYWKYAHQNKIFRVEDFKYKDKRLLKEELWDKLLAGRRLFSNVKGMAELEKKVSAYYKYPIFEKDFDSFMATHTTGNLEDFEREMIEYMRGKQNDILEKIID